MISVTINGERRQLEAPINCAELIAKLDLAGKRVAVVGSAAGWVGGELMNYTLTIFDSFHRIVR